MDADKPWMRPCIYVEPKAEPETELESDPKPEEGLVNRPERSWPRLEQRRDAVKPVGGRSKDTSPMVYRRARPGSVVDLDDEDELTPPGTEPAEESDEPF